MVGSRQRKLNKIEGRQTKNRNNSRIFVIIVQALKDYIKVNSLSLQNRIQKNGYV